MGSLFNPWLIVRAQLATLRRFDTGRYSAVAIALFFGVPLAATTGLLLAGVVVTDQAADVLVTSMSIFTALLLNLQMMVFEAANRDLGEATTDEEKDWRRFRARFLREIFANISFAILAAIVVIVLLLAWVTVGGVTRGMLVLWSALAFYCGALFLMTLSMVLQRVHVLFERHLTDGVA